jgi:hypothetical protein
VDGKAGNRSSLALEAFPQFWIRREVVWQNFDRNVAIQPRIMGAINLAHTARAGGGDNFIGPQPQSWSKRH